MFSLEEEEAAEEEEEEEEEEEYTALYPGKKNTQKTGNKQTKQPQAHYTVHDKQQKIHDSKQKP